MCLLASQIIIDKLVIKKVLNFWNHSRYISFCTGVIFFLNMAIFFFFFIL
jgi:hypothetical protein